MDAVVLGVVVLAGVLVAGLGGVAIFVPADSRTTRMHVLNASIDEVWHVYTDFATQAEWRDEIRAITMTSAPGEAVTWEETYKNGPVISFRLVNAQKSAHRLELALQSGQAFSGSYIAEFEDLGDGRTRGTFTESQTTFGFMPKLLRFLFVRPERIIKKYAMDAQAEIERRRQAGP